MQKISLMTDHDVLVTLNTKFDLLAIDVKDIKDGLVTKVAQLEARIDNIDIYHAGIPLKEYDELAKWVQNFRSNLKFLLTITGLSLAILGGLISQLINKWFNLKL